MVKCKSDNTYVNVNTSFPKSKTRKKADLCITEINSRPISNSFKYNHGTSFMPKVIERDLTASIKVFVRIRPPNFKEHGENFKPVVELIDDETLIFDPEEKNCDGFFFHGVQQKRRDLSKKAKKNIKFNFDRIYHPNSTNFEFFEGTTRSLIDFIMDGYNCSVFAYGATGAGKTFTMTGTAIHPGITFLTMTEMFKTQEKLASEREFELRITYLEVYNELVKDLLNPGLPLHLREDSSCGVIAAGIQVYKIKNADQLFTLLEIGNLNRTQHPTDANAESSRSHAVFQVYLKMTFKRTKEVRTAKLSMIDLAGSERGSATTTAHARFVEGANINKSLLALGNCINSLADGHKHIPYRDSKLTRLLKDTLGGNCQTIMIANISPSSVCYDDTYNTLKYAARATIIKAQVRRNVSKPDLNIVQYAKLVEELTNESLGLRELLQMEKTKNDLSKKECLKLKEELQNAINIGYFDNSLADEIKTLVKQKNDLLNTQFKLKKNEVSVTLQKILKEEIDSRLLYSCIETSKRTQSSEKIKSAIEKFRREEIVLKEDIEKAEVLANNRLFELEVLNPQCGQLIENEKLKLELQKLNYKLVLEQDHTDLLVKEHIERTELMEKMASSLRASLNLLHSHGYITPTIIKQYKEVVQLLKDKVKANSDSGISSISSDGDNIDRKLELTKIEALSSQRPSSTGLSSLLEPVSNSKANISIKSYSLPNRIISKSARSRIDSDYKMSSDSSATLTPKSPKNLASRLESVSKNRKSNTTNKVRTRFKRVVSADPKLCSSSVLNTKPEISSVISQKVHWK